jgi:hypothetical protein
MERFTNIINKMSLNTNCTDVVKKGIEYYKNINKFTNTNDDEAAAVLLSYIILVLIAYYMYSTYTNGNTSHLILVFLFPQFYIVLMLFVLGLTDAPILKL